MIQLDPKRPIAVQFWVICIFLSLFGFGWMTAAYFFKEVTSQNAMIIIGGLSFDAFKAIFIASSVGVVINLFLKHAQERNPRELLESCGIDYLYPTRQSARQDLIKLVNDQNTKRIDIVGISLRDFLTGAGVMRDVWFLIRNRLEREENDKKNLSKDSRLVVRLLLLDYKSGEGIFRTNVENNTMSGGGSLQKEVPIGIEEVQQLKQSIYGCDKTDFLQIRLYEHCPFSFMILTNNELFVEQYYYRDHSKLESLPLLKYKNFTPQYYQLYFSLKCIWDKAINAKVSEFRTGTAASIYKSKINNIYRVDERDICGKRERECIKISSNNHTIDILAITGKFFIANKTIESFRIPAIADETEKRISKKVRIAVVNPISQQAIMRAIADSYPHSNIRENVLDWNFDKHKDTRLYQDVCRTLKEINSWKNDRGYLFEIKLYSSAISCSLVITSKSSFVEQYLYGRSEAFKEGIVLGKEFPIFEYDTRDQNSENKIEKEILASHFNVVWDNYCISFDEFNNQKREEIFNINLNSLRQELGLVKINKK